VNSDTPPLDDGGPYGKLASIPRPPASRSSIDLTDTTARVLVADDDRAAREELAAVLRAEGHIVELCEDGAEALARVIQGGIDLVLLDVVMPKLTGPEACRLIKARTQNTFLPIILVTSRSDAASRAEGLRIGADDYVCKPFHREELAARVAAMLRIKRLIGSLSEERNRLLRTAVHDELTGLPNRRYFEVRLAEERKRAERHYQPFACVLLDVGGAVAPRDGSGSPFSEHLLARSATVMKQSVREEDVVARLGDTMFAALLAHTHFVGAIAASERLLRDICAALDGDEATAGVSIGAVLFPSRDARSADVMLANAESALDEARLAGGGCLCIVQQRRYLYTPGAGSRVERPASRSERPPPPSRTERSPPSVRGERAPLSVRGERAPGSVRAERLSTGRTERPPPSRTERPVSSSIGKRSWNDAPSTDREPTLPEAGERKE
jgi:two-component system, cell cycle response regulator